MDCSDVEAVRKAIEEGRQSVSIACEAQEKASGKKVGDIIFKRFLRALVQDIKRKRKRQRGKPSPQLYTCQKETLQELEYLDSKRNIELYYVDESHVCTDAYVPYSWQFEDENIYIPFEKTARQHIGYDYPKKSI